MPWHILCSLLMFKFLVDKVISTSLLGLHQALATTVLSIYECFINALLSPHLWGLTSKLGGWMSSTFSILGLSPCPFASLSDQSPASSCSEVQRIVFLPFYSFCLHKLLCKIGILNLKTVLYYIDTNKHSHSVFSPLFLPCWHCQDRWFAFPLSTFSDFKTVVEIFSHCTFSGWPVCFFSLYSMVRSFLKVIWSVKEYLHSWRTLYAGQLKFKALNIGRDIKPRVGIIVRKPIILFWATPKADSERRIWVQGFGRWSQETQRGNEEIKQGRKESQQRVCW